MRIDKLYLQNFRRFENQTFEFTASITILIARNGYGKTTVLEAISLLSSGQSFRADKTAEMLRFAQDLARVYGLTDDQTKLGITLTGGLVNGRKTPSKLYTLGDAKKRQQDFAGQLLSVSFRPEDLRLIEGSPSRRRDYLDEAPYLVSDLYRGALRNYQSTLIRRNKLLTAIREGEASLASLPYWNDNLRQYGEIIHQQRQQYLDFLNQEVAFALDFEIFYDHSTVTVERLAKYQAAEIAVGHSLIGPHKDDFDIRFDFNTAEKKSLLTYGSRGQHRLAVFWLKLAQLQFLQHKTQQQPVLLLDDIFSELDQEAQQLVVNLATKQQTIITTTEAELLKLFPAAQVIKL